MARKKSNSAKINLIFSTGLHVCFVLVIFFFAAREGLVGRKLQEITATLVPKEKPPEEKPKLPEPMPEPPKEEAPKPVVAQTPQEAPPPSASVDVPVAAAPAPSVAADFAFDDGAKIVETSTNAQVSYYKNFVEWTLRSHWTRPDGIADDSFVAEIEVKVDSAGKINSYSWKKNTGNKTWDDSVEKAIKEARSIGKSPPTNFPPAFLVRFDVLPATESVFE
jgi:outer membrane biosynthesis protein TonB